MSWTVWTPQAQDYARILFIDYSSAFNTILPPILEQQPALLQVPDCRWITNFSTNRTQMVKLGRNISSSRSTCVGSPQGCVLSPLLSSLYTNSCVSLHSSVKLLKFADTTLVGVTSNGEMRPTRERFHPSAARLMNALACCPTTASTTCLPSAPWSS